MYCNKHPPRLKGWGLYAHEVYVDGARWLRPSERAHVVTTSHPILEINIHTSVAQEDLFTPDLSTISALDSTLPDAPSSASNTAHTRHVPASVSPPPASVLDIDSPPDIAREGGVSGTQRPSSASTHLTVSFPSPSQESLQSTGGVESSNVSTDILTQNIVSTDVVSKHVSTQGHVSTILSSQVNTRLSSSSSSVSTNTDVSRAVSSVSPGGTDSTHSSTVLSDVSSQMTSDFTAHVSGELAATSNPDFTSISNDKISAVPGLDEAKSDVFKSDTPPSTPLHPEPTVTSTSSLLPSKISSQTSTENFVPSTSTSITTQVSISPPSPLKWQSVFHHSVKFHHQVML